MDEKELEKLYNAVNSKFDIGDYSQFKTKMSTPEDRKKFYDVVGNKGFDLGDYNEYEKRIAGQPAEVVQKPIIDQALEADRLSKLGVSTFAGNIDIFEPDQKAVAEGKKIKTDLQAQGIPADKIVDNFTNLTYTPEKKAQYEELAKTNPQQLNRLLSHDAYKMPAMTNFNKQLADAQANNDVQEVKRLTNAMLAIDRAALPGNYSDVRARIKSAAEGVRGLSDDPDKSGRDFGEEAALVYGRNMIPSFRDGKWYQPDGDKNLSDQSVYDAGLNTYHKAALDFLQDTDSQKYEAFKGILTPLKSRDPKNIDQRIGYQEHEKNMEQLGIKLKYDAAMESYNEAKSSGDQQGMEIYRKSVNETIADSKTIDDRYPLLKIIDAEQKTIDINGRPDNPVQRFGKVMGSAVDNTVSSVWDVASAPFRSEEGYQNHLMEVLGGSKINNLETYLPTEDRTIIDSKVDLTPGAKTDIDRIKNSNLSDTEKQTQIRDYVLAHPDKVKRRAVDPETNISLKSILYGVTDLGASIAPYVALSAATGGGASATALRSFGSEFSSAALTMYHDELAVAIERGDENPYAAAFRRTAVMSFAMAGAGTAGKIRELAMGSKNPALKAMIASMDDKAIEKGIADATKSKAAQLLGTIKDKVIESAKTSAKITPAISAGNIANKLIDNEPISAKGEVSNLLVEGLKFFVFGSVAGIAGSLKNRPDDLSKLSIYEAAKDPEKFNTEINTQLESGKLTPDQHAEIKTNIDLAKKVMDKTALIDNRGKPLNDKKARDLLFLKFQEAKANDLLSKDIPETVQNNVTKLLEGITTEIKQLQITRKPEADTGLSQPIEGVDNQGVPQGDDVPPPVDLREEKLNTIADKVVAKEKLTPEETDFINHEDNLKDFNITLGKKVMANNKKATPEKNKSKEKQSDNPIQAALDRYNNDQDGHIGNLVNDIEEHAQETGNKNLTAAVDKYREQERENLDQWGGRGDTEHEDEFVKAVEAEATTPTVSGIAKKIFERQELSKQEKEFFADNVPNVNDEVKKLANSQNLNWGDFKKEENKKGETWNNRGTVINENGEFVGKDGNKYSISHTIDKDGKVIVTVKDGNGETASSASFEDNGDGSYSTAMGSNVESKIKSIGLAKAIYDYVDNNIGKIKKTSTTTFDGENLWRNNQPTTQKEEVKPVDATALLKYARENGKLGVFKTMEDEAALKMISQQAQDLDSKGRAPIDKAYAKIAMESTVKAFGQELVDAAIKKYPAEELKNEVHYEDKNGNQVITGKDGLKTVVNKKGEEVSAPTKRRVINEHMADFDFSAGERAPEPTHGIDNEADAMQHVAETSSNPAELAEIYDKNHEAENLNDVETAIANHGIGKVTESSYNRFGDRNNMNNSKARSYIAKDGQKIDSLAKTISDHTGVEVSPEDVVAFMDRFPNGQDVLKEKPNETGKKASARFQEITGFKLDSKTSEIARMQEPTELTPEETAIANSDISPDIAEQIIKDEGLTKETLEENKHLFNGFPYTKEDYEAVKNLLYGEHDGLPTEGSENGGQENTGNADNKETSVPGEEDTEDTGIKPEGREERQTSGQNADKVTTPDNFEQKIDDAADAIINFLTPKAIKEMEANGITIQKSGLSVDQIVKGAAEAIKIAYRAGKEIKDAIEEAIDYVKKNWNPQWGELPEQKLRDIFEKGMEEKLKEDADLKNLTREQVAAILKKNAADKTFINSIKNSGIVQSIKKIWTGTIRALHPFLLDGKEQGRDAAMIIRKNTGTEAHENVVADKASEDALSFWNKKKRVDNVAFMLSMENPDAFGGIHGDQRALAVEYRNRMDKVFDMISKIRDVNFIDDYFPHFWKKPDKARATLPNLGKNPLEGNKSFLKQRFYSNIMDGLNAGLELATYNPEEMVRLAEQNALHFKTANDIFTDLKSKGLLKYFQGKAEDGWVKINDPMFNKKAAVALPDGGAKPIEGAYYGRDAVASVLNNYTAKGLFKRGGAVGTISKNIRYYNNVKNQVQLGMGLFHFTTTSIDATVTGWGNSLKLLTTGKPLLMAKGAFDLVKSATVLPNLISTFVKGYRANKLYKEGAAAQEVNDLVTAGARVKMQKIYAIDAAYNMKKAWQNFTADHRPADLGKAAWHGMWVLPEKLVGHYLMDVWVPGLKTGGYLKTLETELAANPNMTDRETQKIKNRIWDSMDSRLGQIVYDNVFWDKTIKDLGFMGVRSLGWTSGTMKAFGTGVADVPKSLKNVVQGKGIEHTTAWMVSLPLAVGLYGALYQYMMTGKGPQELKDYFFPKDGSKDSDGNDNRVSMPTYMKDVYAYAKDPLQTAQHKLAPFMNEMTDMMNNKDFYGVRIFNPKDNLFQKGLDILKYQANTMVPFSLKKDSNSDKGFFETVASKEGVEKIFGVQPANKEFERTDIQNIIMEEAYKKDKEEAKTKEEAALQGYRHEVIKGLRAGVEYKDIPQELKDKAKYTGSGLRRVIRDSKKDYYGVQFGNLTSEQQLDVWSKMTPEDKKMYGKFINNYKSFHDLFLKKDYLLKSNPEYKDYLQEMIKYKAGDDDN